jgi:hypothetical protein
MQQAGAQLTVIEKTHPVRPIPMLPNRGAPYIPPAPIPPPEYDGTYKGKLAVTNMEDYGVIRFLCKSTTAVACTVHTWTDCLILLGPGTWSSKDIMRHELGHCAGWPSDHPGAR